VISKLEETSFSWKIKNQKISHYLIVPTFTCTMLFYGIFLFFLIIFAIILLSVAASAKDFQHRYDEFWYFA
jgi:hypothetical protein